MIFDQITKIYINNILNYGESIFVNSYFNIILVYNEGAAFSFLANQGGWQKYFLIFFSTIASVIILIFLKKNLDKKLFCLALSFILGGALGNLIDRILYGYVTDFLDIHIDNLHWPAFNIADSSITIGAILLIIDELVKLNRK